MPARRRSALLTFGLLLTVPAAASAQLGTRPADEWVKVLDSPERIAEMKIDQVVSDLQLRAGEVVADLGAGSGPFEPALAKAVSPGGRVYAVEIDKNFFPHIEARARAAGASNVQMVLGTPADPKLPAADVDLAFLHDVLHHVADRPAYLRTLATYLKPTARIAIVDYNPAQSPHKDDPSLQVSKEQAAEMLAAAGFVHAREVALAPDKWFVIYSR